MTDVCKHFRTCGGCRSQDVPYEEQVKAKGEALRALFAKFWDGPVEVEPSPTPWNYRNKVDFGFGLKRYPEPPPKDFERESVLGFKARGRWYWPLDIDECLIAPEGVGDLLGTVRAWMKDQDLKAFDSRSKQGFLRALLVREGKRTGDRMVVLITADGEFDKASFVEAVLSGFPATSIQWGINRGLADVAFADETEILHGAPTIDECLHVPTDAEPRELRFRLSPFSFFQTNTFATERLYGRIRQWVQDTGARTLYDLYGGGGGIALSCADLVDQIWSVENVQSASDDGRHNMQVNGVEHIEFLTNKVKNYLKDLLQGDGMAPDCAAVVDPSRSGMTPKAMRRLIELRPPKILYVSCKPTVFARELPQFLEAYRLDDLRAVDLFPHTDHVEALASFSLK
ncbi:MAG: 23S rRNA (uracil(1939)-C(5))-methyltransferase RlmD [Nitrospiraceae bacterium]|nr:23S rRNA (uracil(1939)-C(5))-methyltransferase RlmD [Nitrospiraceae bacterium]